MQEPCTLPFCPVHNPSFCSPSSLRIVSRAKKARDRHGTFSSRVLSPAIHRFTFTLDSPPGSTFPIKNTRLSTPRSTHRKDPGQVSVAPERPNNRGRVISRFMNYRVPRTRRLFNCCTCSYSSRLKFLLI